MDNIQQLTYNHSNNERKIKIQKIVVLTSTNCLDKNLFTIVANEK
jgi:hypothetical protein